MICRRCIPLLLALLIAACDSPTEPDSQPTIEGSIVATNVELATVRAPSIHVRHAATDECGIVFDVAAADILIRRSNGSSDEGSISDLTIGRNVRVWADGGVLTSCPAQASASVVVVLSAST